MMMNQETKLFLTRYVPKKYWNTIEEAYSDSEGHWIFLKDEYKTTTTDSHTIHEYTIKDIKKTFKTIFKINEDKNLEG